MNMNWQQVLHTPGTASTRYCLSTHHLNDYEMTSECIICFRCASLYKWLPSDSSPWELKDTVTLSHCHGCKLTNCWIGLSTLCAIHQPPPRTHPISLHHSLQLYLHIHWIMASKCAHSWSPNVHHHCLQVHLQTCSITASKSITKCASLQPTYSHDHGLLGHLHTCSILASQFRRLWPPTAYLLTGSITASKWISKLPRLQPPCLHNHGLPVYLQSCPITALKCISEFTRSSFSGAAWITLKTCLQPVQIYRV